ncbi:MAG: DUF6318 family protein [Jatrophihabitans sp.]
MHFRWLVPIALALGLAAGCTSEGGAGTSGSPSVPISSSAPPTVQTPTATPTPKSSSATVPTTGPNVRPGEKPPVLTGLARDNSPPGAVDFTLFWFESVDWAYATTDSTLARQQFSKLCTGCERFMKNIIDESARKNEHFRGGRLSVTTRALAKNDGHNGSSAVVDTRVNQTKFKLVSAQGKTVDTSNGVSGARFRTWLAWLDGRWVVVDWKQDSQ